MPKAGCGSGGADLVRVFPCGPVGVAAGGMTKRRPSTRRIWGRETCRALIYRSPTKIQKQVGFHTFRHTYTTLLTQNNEEVKVVQDLLRHANSRITLDLCAQAGMPNKRLAQSKLVRMFLNKGEALA